MINSCLPKSDDDKFQNHLTICKLEARDRLYHFLYRYRCGQKEKKEYRYLKSVFGLVDISSLGAKDKRRENLIIIYEMRSGMNDN